MTRHDDQISLRHMLDHTAEAINLAHNKSRQAFNQDRVLQLALTRLLEIIGEAAGRVSQEGRDQYPGIAWHEVIGMRNRLDPRI